jgi:uncharacterized repeat protein (TIGR01451 family)
MVRKVAGIAACILFLGLVAFSVAAWAQEHSQGATRSLTFGERLERLRRNIVGGEESPAEHHAHHHHSTHGSAPRMASSTARSASSAAKSSSGRVQSAPAGSAPRLTRQSAVPAQPSGSTSTHLIRRQPRSASTARSPAGGSSARRRDAFEEEVSEEAFEPEEAPARPIRRRTTSRDEPSEAMRDEPTEALPERAEPKDEFEAPEETEEFAPVSPLRSPPDSPRRTRPETRRMSPDKDVLFSRQSPVLSVETIGPRRVTVGRPAEYKINLKNDGQFAASDVVVRVNVPTSVEVHEARASAGTAGMLQQEAGVLQWSLPSLAIGADEQLALQLVTRENRPFDLSVRWASAAIGSNATVEVQEAKLELKIAGAGEVLCGAKEIYRLSVSNPGNGDAENVMIRLLPLVPGEGEGASHRIGSLPAGETKTVEIELVARQGGTLSIQAEAVADGDLKAVALEEVVVRQPALDVAIVAPERLYAGAESTYEIHLQNPGDAAARHVKLAASLPAGAAFVSCTRDGKFDSKRNRVVWSLDDLSPGADETLQVTCSMQAAGQNQLEVTAIADGDLKRSQLAVTEVIAVADLVLDVADPSGPVAVGHDAIYELRVRNRGTKSAEGVEIVAFYSKGIEPVSAEGGAHEISPGTVVFDPIATLGAGEETVFKIHARAETGGTHRFRVELQCKPLNTKLTQEETTLFYGDASPTMHAGKSSRAPSDAAPARAAKKTIRSELR